VCTVPYDEQWITAAIECLMPCTEMKELEAACTMFGERRQVALAPTSERRKMSADWLQARAAYVMRSHRRNCPICRFDS
jgi:hypothetical protein